MPRSSALHPGTLRREIAALAARMMAEDGINDYGYAKRKAAKQLGAIESESLPNNAEIEAELRIYQSIYQDDEHAERLYLLRKAAVGVMRELAAFRPYLTGAVLDGTAGRYAEVEIELFPESAKEVEIFFLNRDVPYEHHEPRRKQADSPEAILLLDWGEVPVRLAIYPPDVERVNRRGYERARIAAVEALLTVPAETST
ncbi:MAG: hypothetical protein HGA47_05480 [Zoogloea sp.]|nr:hypothetical protein [Zoogloea sp.]